MNVGISPIESTCKKHFQEIQWNDYFIIYLLLCFSGNVSITNLLIYKPLQVLFALYLFILLRKKRTIINQRIIIFIYIFFCILLIQCIEFNFYPFFTISGFFIRVIIAFAVVSVVNNFFYVYIKVMVYLAIISFFFYGLQELGGLVGYDVKTIFAPVGSYFSDSPRRIPFIVHTYLADNSHRNSGMFWEPGAFAGYLIIGLIFLSIIKTQIAQKEYKYYLVVLSFALLTTMSTTGYIAYPFAMVLHFNRNNLATRVKFRNSLLLISVVTPLFIITSYNAYQNLPFLETKVIEQFQRVEFEGYRWHLTRFGSIMFDWEYIKIRPLTGWGLHSETRFALTPNMDGLSGMGNGLSDFLAKFGIIGFSTWIFFVFSGIKQGYDRSIYRTLISTFTLLLLLQGEAFLNYPLFLSLAFVNCRPP